jgi:hypothetical protein
MNKMLLGLSAAAIGATMLGVPAFAAPDKPLNAAVTDSGTVCIVRSGELDPYKLDVNCEWHTVTKSDKDGNLVSFRYQDKGDLQPGQTAPDRAVRIPITSGANCTGTEVISPSGHYSSNLTCNY